MIKCKIDREKDHVWVKAGGKGSNISVETLALICEVYRGMHEQNPTAAATYKLEIIAAVLDPNSPVWKTEE